MVNNTSANLNRTKVQDDNFSAASKVSNVFSQSKLMGNTAAFVAAVEFYTVHQKVMEKVSCCWDLTRPFKAAASEAWCYSELEDWIDPAGRADTQTGRGAFLDDTLCSPSLPQIPNQNPPVKSAAADTALLNRAWASKHNIISMFYVEHNTTDKRYRRTSKGRRIEPV